MLAEDGYLLDNSTCIEIESLFRFQGHSTVLAGLIAFSPSEKEMQYFIDYKLPSFRVFSIPSGIKRLIARNEYVRVLQKIFWSGTGSVPPVA